MINVADILRIKRRNLRIKFLRFVAEATRQIAPLRQSPIFLRILRIF